MRLSPILERDVGRNYAPRSNVPPVVTATSRRDNTMATVLTAIVFVFIVCHTPKAALNLYEVGTVGSQLKVY